MPDKLTLEIATPDRLVLSEEVDEVIMPGIEGYLGVRQGHAPLLTQLDVGEISFRKGSTEQFLACSGGFTEVQPDRVSVLAQTAELADEIDVERARTAQSEAEAQLKTDLEGHELQRAEVRLKRAISRMRVSGRKRV